jgi:hypothetical protein
MSSDQSVAKPGTVQPARRGLGTSSLDEGIGLYVVPRRFRIVAELRQNLRLDVTRQLMVRAGGRFLQHERGKNSFNGRRFGFEQGLYVSFERVTFKSGDLATKPQFALK